MVAKARRRKPKPREKQRMLQVTRANNHLYSLIERGAIKMGKKKKSKK